MVFDIETDGLDPTLVHCLSYTLPDGKGVNTVTDYDGMRDILMAADTLIGHNIIRYDLPVLEKLLGFTPSKSQRIIDTLPLSWYVYHSRGKHGLAHWGEQFGVPKPVIDDWENLSIEEYSHRCEQDVLINKRLWGQLKYSLERLYKTPEAMDKCINYLTFKMQCAAEQEKLGWRIDVEKAQRHLDELEALRQEKVHKLTEAMPEQVSYTPRNRPKVWTKADGSPSALAHKWMDLMDEMHLPHSTQTVRVVSSVSPANPNSITQVKAWLYDLGWSPATFEYHRDKNTGDERAVEQIRKDGELCESVRVLAEREPAVELLEGLTIINHRMGIFKAFVGMAEDGYVRATVSGLTNTLRFRHAKPLVNLPAVDKPWGKEIRGCLIAPDGYTLCGADMVSLEDTTKRHYMQPHDPDYVEEMSREGFDPHLDLALFAGKVTQDDIDQYNAGKLDLKPLRKKYKVVNYSATYGVGATKLSRTMGITQAEASSMLDAFWTRNRSIQDAVEGLKVREIEGSSWLLNPVSGIYHSLRFEKDKFSTLNQSTGVYCFDTWVAGCRARGLKVIGQFHDEVIVLVKEGTEDWTKTQMEISINKTNKRINRNVPLGIDVQFGKNYAEIH